MQYVFFEKGTRSVQWRKAPEAGEFSRICVKSNPAVCKV